MATSDISINISSNADQIIERIGELTKRLKQLEAQNKKAEGNVSSNRQRIDKINEELAADKKLTAARQRKIASLKEERAALGRSIGGQNAQIQVRQREIDSLKRGIAATKAYGEALEKISKPALRYALYDISSSLRQVALATAALAVAPIGFAIKYEREFANVVRTSDLAGQAANEARDQLLGALRDISQATPISWTEITDIATLAGQLGISTELVADFTDNVAKFSATTDLTVEAAATAFGRLTMLIDGAEGQFAELGSAILAVGVDSIATESQIVGVATQIASMGNLAELSAADIIGLSGSLASLGIAPELARGVVTRLFSDIGAAVATGGYELEEFSRLSGRSAEEFTSAWGTSQSINVILDFFDGLGQTAGDAERTLRDLGITSVRDIPALLRLAQSSDEVRRLVALSNDEFDRGQKIQEQYAIIAGTTAEELRRLVQNFELLAATVGQSIPGLAQLFASLSNVTAGITDFLATTPGQILSGVAIALALVVSAATAAGAILTALIAGFSALVFASRTLGVDLGLLGFRAIFSAKGLQSAGLGALTANASFMRLATTIKFGTLAFGAIGVAIAVVGGIMSAYGQRVQQVQSVTNSLLSDQAGLSKALQADADGYSKLSDSAKEAAEGYMVLEKAQIGVEKTSSDQPFYLQAIDELSRRVAVAKEKEAAATELQEEKARRLLDVQGDSVSTSGDLVSSLDAEAEAAKKAADEYLILGENVALYLRQQASESPEIQGALSIPEVSTAFVGQFDNFESFTDLIIGNPEEASARLDEVFAEIDKATNMYSSTGAFFSTLFLQNRDEIDAINAAKDALTGYVEAGNPERILELAKANDILNEGMPQLEAQAALAAGEVDGLMESLFGAENAAGAGRDAVGKFFDELANGADTSDVTSKSFQEMIVALAGNEFRSVQDRLGDMNAVLQRLKDEGQGTSQMALLLTQAMLQLAAAADLGTLGIEGMPEGLTTVEDKMEFLISKAEPLVNLFSGIGAGAEDAGTKMGGAGARAETLAEQFDKLTNSMFEAINLGRDTEDAIFALGEAFGETGSEALYASDEMQDAIGAILAQSGSAEQGVANLAALFVHLSKTAGGQSAPSLQILRQAISQVGAQFGMTEAQVQQFINTAGGGLSNINLDNFNRGVQNAQKEVRTLLDYASDLEQVFSRAFDIRFAETMAIDDIAESWADLADRVEDARKEIEELQATQQSLGADRAIKEYFLSVAEAYGDTLRAAKLRNEIAELDREQAENASRLEESQAATGGNLTGSNPASIQNRRALLGLVGEYQDYITALAESGATQAELTAATQQARQEFIQQATELGFQESVVLEYAKAFDDVQTAIDKVPRNVTVDANVNPALQALNELNASLNKNIDAARALNTALGQPNFGGGGGGGAAKEARRVALVAEIDRLTKILNDPRGGTAGRDQLAVRIQGLRDKLASGNYATGGFTGQGGTMEPAGIVHRGEYVVPKKYVNQSTGMPDPSFLAQLQNGMRSYNVGGPVGSSSPASAMIVELSPVDRNLLRSVGGSGDIVVSVDSREIARAANKGNKSIISEGGRP